MSDLPQNDPLVGQVVLGRYSLQKVIGSGGMGSVYVANQTAVNRPVAVKVLRPDLLQSDELKARFKREAEIIGRLRHPHNIQLFDYGETPEGMAVMVTELLVGHPLQDLLRGGGTLSLEDTLRLGEQVAGALAEAHDMGLVHRDLKPANIFVTEVEGQVHAKVLDFGIARLVDEEKARLTATGQIFGTPRYMSPEQTMSAADVDGRSDIYSLGLVLYECISGGSPFQAETSVQYLAAHHNQEPPHLVDRVPDVPPQLDRLIQSMLRKDPNGRPADARVVRKALLSISGRDATRMETALEEAIPTVSDGNLPAGMLDDGYAQTFVPTQAAGPATPPAPAPPAPATGRPATASPLVLGLLVLGTAGVALGGFALTRGGPSAEAIDPLAVGPVRDAGTRTLPDGGAEPWADAGVSQRAADLGPDLSTESNPQSDVQPSPDRSPGTGEKESRRRRRPPSGKAQVVTGPRGMTIPVQETRVDWKSRAQACTTSDWRGLGALTTRDCPSGCAILVDEMCAGLTPAANRSIAPGRREVRIFCGDEPKLKVHRRVRFRENNPTIVSCR